MAIQGEELTAANTLGDADGLGDISYQWLRDGVEIEGAIASTYTLTESDIGALISVTASYTDEDGADESVTSSTTDAVASGLTESGSGADDTLTGSAGNDSLSGNDGNDTLRGLAGDDALDGGAGNDLLTGGHGDDTLYGWAGDDFLNGSAGVDTAIGGTGNDKYYVNDAGDVIVEADGEGQDRVLADTDYALSAGVVVEFLSARNQLKTTSLNLTGNEFGQSILGNAGDNILDGAGGDDVLVGGGGTDTLIGGTGNDVFRVDGDDIIIENGGEGSDMVRASSSYTLAEGVSVETLTTVAANKTASIDLTGNSFNNLIYGNAGTNVLSGGGGIDRLHGLGGNDTLIGGAGADKLSGGAGNDLFVFNAVTDSSLSNLDQIPDFANGDLIDLAGIDANSGLADDQAFTFVGTDAFTNTAGELRYEQVNGNTMVYGNTNGDGVADFAISLTGPQTLLAVTSWSNIYSASNVRFGSKGDTTRGASYGVG